mmetsp:Transcript_10097/g.15303  ORF Transcript_10097/g.15303 Transcript_10097/m.15303 type:complete len:425 (-) Transcript_10097:216-1490(-)|eukprot:CAMPEP_0185024254 /NCGR_PEP_ID=MMETSP1103-20130426/7245_1 /TAXON_ID=36769 /ORGANISM="Paraphysomonas bandaiensis, Strain Caron Lab Isolate" /LENGTH=424 /DNA_ID=CAMNT_0027557173 /DNA_START=137 /DNA_END=1411 /DNA_ORIENTATION=-
MTTYINTPQTTSQIQQNDQDEAPDDPSGGNNDIIVLECTLPKGVVVGRTKYGYGVFASENFIKGQVLYTGTYTLIDDDGRNRPIKLVTNTGIYDMTTEMHTVGVGVAPNKKRQAFTFDAFMNHSCNPNTYSADEHDTATGGTYKTVALRDIAAGTEITCDYDLFELDSRKKGIDKCECGSAECRGFSHGFNFMPEAVQMQVFNRVYSEVVEAWLAQKPNVMFRRLCAPEGIAIKHCEEDGSMCLVASKRFEPGEVMYTYHSEYFDSSVIDTILVSVRVDHTISRHSRTTSGSSSDSGAESVITGISSDDSTPTPVEGENPQNVEMWDMKMPVVRKLDLLAHTVNRGENRREFFGFDTFCDHSCDPNASFVYVNGSLNSTVTTARRVIEIGQKITCDYTAFDEGRDGTAFVCDCGAENCKGVIAG